jgi:hypothetical protein
MARNINRSAVIPLKPDYEESSVHWIKHAQSRDVAGVSEKTTVKVPRLSEDSGTSVLLTFIREFQRTRAIMSWTTGPKLFEKFEMHLQGLHRQTWSNEAAGQAQTAVMFDLTVLAFKGQLLENKDYANQLDYPYKAQNENANKYKQEKADSQNPTRSNHNQGGSGNFGRGGRGGDRCRGGQRQGQDGQGRIQSNNPCPLPGHAGHTWGKCWAN